MPSIGRCIPSLIAAGKRADLLLVNGDPTRDIEALAEIRTVLPRGAPLVRKAVE